MHDAPVVRRIDIRPSRRLLAYQLAAHLLFAGAVLLAAVPSWLTAALLLGVGASAARLRRPESVSALLLRADGVLQILAGDDVAQTVQLHPQTTVLPFLVILRYRGATGAAALVLLADSLEDEDARALRRWLIWRAAAV